jgi:hypothetical protein
MTNYLNKLQQWLTPARWEQFKTDERIQKLTEEQKQKVAKEYWTHIQVQGQRNAKTRLESEVIQLAPMNGGKE